MLSATHMLRIPIRSSRFAVGRASMSHVPRNQFEDITLQFFQALANRKSWTDVNRFYHPRIEQIEYPNAITKVTAVRNIEDLKSAAERGQKVLQREEYDVLKMYSSGQNVIVEALWKGTLAIPIGSLKVGDQMVAHFAQFFEYDKDEKDGLEKIIRQRNYDCFDPFA